MQTRSALITADFNRRVDHPLSKSSFAIFNSGLVHPATYERDARHLVAAHPEHCRIDIGWGAEWMEHPHPVATSTAEGVSHDFRDLDAIAVTLTGAGVRPYWSYCYVPEPFRPDGGDWRDLEDLTGWAEMIRAYAEGAKERGVSVGYHEVYNEPDLRDERTGEPVFYSGGLNDYLDMYRATAPALRKVDPDVPVGGPALALVHPDEHWIPAFLDAVLSEGLPLDFFSFHHYGSYTLGTAIDKVLTQLDSRPELAEVEAHLNEYNAFPIDYPRGGLQDGYLIVGAMLADFARLLATPGLTMTSWAQFLDSGHDNYSGMIGIDGDTKPIFHGYRLYQDMPIDRFALDSDLDGVNGFAASEPGRTCLLIWNRSAADVDVTIDATSLRSAATGGRLVRFDSEHDGDTDVALDVATLRWTLPLQRAAVIYLELTDDAAAADEAPYGQVQRVHRSYVSRRAAAWADLDEASTTFRLGTADSPTAVPVIAGRLRAGSAVMNIEADLVSASGERSSGGVLTLRLDSGDSAVTIELGPDAARHALRPSWLGPSQGQELGHFPDGRASIDLISLGIDPDDVTATVFLVDAPAGSFACLQLRPGA